MGARAAARDSDDRSENGASAELARSLFLGPCNRDVAWRIAMHGARLPMLAEFPRGSPGVDRRLRGYVERIHQEMASTETCGEAKPTTASRGQPIGPVSTNTPADDVVEAQERGRGSSRRRRR